jgi:hypothetical protein
VNAGMSLVVGSPQKWRSADPAQRQAILATLTSKLSLAFEASVGVILIADLVFGFLQVLFGLGGRRPAWYEIVTKLLVVRLFVHYLLYNRRKKISQLAMEARGGALQLPFFILDALYCPAKALGIDTKKSSIGTDGSNKDTIVGDLTLIDCLSVGLGLDIKS